MKLSLVDESLIVRKVRIVVAASDSPSLGFVVIDTSAGIFVWSLPTNLSSVGKPLFSAARVTVFTSFKVYPSATLALAGALRTISPLTCDTVGVALVRIIFPLMSEICLTDHPNSC
jgi:hypothetical protein